MLGLFCSKALGLTSRFMARRPLSSNLTRVTGERFAIANLLLVKSTSIIESLMLQ
jgi:hypothetical protein